MGFGFVKKKDSLQHCITPGFLLFPIIIIFSSGVLCQKLSRWYIWPRSSIMQSHRIVNYKMNDSSVTSWTPLISQEITFHWNIQDFSPLPPETGYTFKPIVINLQTCKQCLTMKMESSTLRVLFSEIMPTSAFSF